MKYKWIFIKLSVTRISLLLMMHPSCFQSNFSYQHIYKTCHKFYDIQSQIIFAGSRMLKSRGFIWICYNHIPYFYFRASDWSKGSAINFVQGGAMATSCHSYVDFFVVAINFVLADVISRCIEEAYYLDVLTVQFHK